MNPPDPRAVEVIEADARRYTEVRGGGRELNVTIDSFVRFLSRHLADAGLLVTDEMRAVLDSAVAVKTAWAADDVDLWMDANVNLLDAVDAYLAAGDDQ